jgi:hypothetical protein
MSIAARIRTALGWATADRREEARGKLQELDAADPSADDRRDLDESAPTTTGQDEALLDEAELHVRGDHGDLAPQAEPDDRPLQQPPTPG